MSRVEDVDNIVSKLDKKGTVYLCFPFNHPDFGTFRFFEKAIVFFIKRGLTPMVSLSHFADCGDWALDLHTIHETIDACDRVVICSHGIHPHEVPLTERQLYELRYAKSVGKRVIRVACL